MMPSADEIALVDRWQRGFPLSSRPFAEIGRAAGLDEAATLATFRKLHADGVLSRIGAVVRPHTVGASTLAAMRVPSQRLDEVAGLVSAEPLVNHNYEREHPINLWFVVAGPDRDAVAQTLARIEQASGIGVIELPLLQAFHIDLGFSLLAADGAGRDSRSGSDGASRPLPPLLRGKGHSPASGRASSSSFVARAMAYRPDSIDRSLLAAIEDGLPLTEQPYLEVASRLRSDEAEVIDRLARLSAEGVVSRFGCVVRHRPLGFAANAMAVWNVPDETVAEVGAAFAQHPRVTLCYRRPRRLPHWPFNLFCMVHAGARAEALAVIDELDRSVAAPVEHAVLFSTRCFKQRGARFSACKGEMH
ncbi:MAG: Lrp/AsnC family transcriptional regulator [Hyphomicrobiales bacterium]|nr:Lrp/AsnC family transcriptional regulator [Hyphomicrobiales bacterium]